MPRLPASPVENSLEGRVFVFCAFAVACIAIAIYGQDYIFPAAGLALAAIGHVVSYRGRAKRRSVLGQLLLAGLIISALGYFLADSVGAIFGGQMPQANFAVLLVAITSFDLKTRRNCYSTLWISLAILYLAAVYAWDYAFGLLVALWVVNLAGFWVASHLRRMDARLALPVRPVAVALTGALVLGVAVFIFVPQPSAFPTGPLVVSLPTFSQFKGELENPALPLVQFAGSPGSSDSIDLRYRGRLGDAPVMYVRTGAAAYWRGLVFDTYTGGVWHASQHGGGIFPAYVTPRLLGPGPTHNLGTFVQTFRLLRDLPGVVNAAYPIQSLYVPVGQLAQDAYGTFRTPGPLKAGQTYSVVSYIPDLSAGRLRQDGFGSNVLPEGFARYMDPGPLSGRATALSAAAVKGHTDTQYDMVAALTGYLQSNYRYSLQLGHVPPGVDPVDWFLFDVKIGYCEQFATAETLMLRSLGIPARLATGYSTGAYDPVLNQAVVRERDAHAWVEVWFPGDGWVPVDASPGYPAMPSTQFPNHWAAGGIARLIPHLEIGGLPAVLGSLGLVGLLPVAAGLVLVVAIAYAWLRRRRSRRGAPARGSPGESELLGLYERVQHRIGRWRALPETPLEYRRDAPAGPFEPLLEEVTHAVNQGVYAGRWPEPDRVREMEKQLP